MPLNTIWVVIGVVVRARKSSVRPAPFLGPLKTSMVAVTGSGKIGSTETFEVPLPMCDPAGQPSGALAAASRLGLQAGKAPKFVFAPRGNLICRWRSGGGCVPSGLAIVTPTPTPIDHGLPFGWLSSVAVTVSVVVGAALAGAATRSAPATTGRRACVTRPCTT